MGADTSRQEHAFQFLVTGGADKTRHLPIVDHQDKGRHLGDTEMIGPVGLERDVDFPDRISGLRQLVNDGAHLLARSACWRTEVEQLGFASDCSMDRGPEDSDP